MLLVLCNIECVLTFVGNKEMNEVVYSHCLPSFSASRNWGTMEWWHDPGIGQLKGVFGAEVVMVIRCARLS